MSNFPFQHFISDQTYRTLQRQQQPRHQQRQQRHRHRSVSPPSLFGYVDSYTVPHGPYFDERPRPRNRRDSPPSQRRRIGTSQGSETIYHRTENSDGLTTTVETIEINRRWYPTPPSVPLELEGMYYDSAQSRRDDDYRPTGTRHHHSYTPSGSAHVRNNPPRPSDFNRWQPGPALLHRDSPPSYYTTPPGSRQHGITERPEQNNATDSERELRTVTDRTSPHFHIDT